MGNVRRIARLSFARQLAAVCTLFLIPLGVAVLLISRGIHDEIEFAVKEKSGNRMERPLLRLLYHAPFNEAQLAKERAVEAYRSVEAGAAASSAEQRARISPVDEAVRELETITGNAAAGASRTSRDLHALAGRAVELRELVAELAPLAGQ
jgi:hypothetical protein